MIKGLILTATIAYTTVLPVVMILVAIPVTGLTEIPLPLVPALQATMMMDQTIKIVKYALISVEIVTGIQDNLK